MKLLKTKLDILAFGAHPDDVDACVGGTIAKSVSQGLNVGIIDLNDGNGSDSGNGKTRLEESQNSAKILGVNFRKNLKLPERYFVSPESENVIINEIRNLKPDIVLLPHWHDRHKGHRDASKLIESAVQYSKYSKYLRSSPPHKVKVVLYYMIHYEFTPSLIMNMDENTHAQKIKAFYCHRSQLFKKNKNGKYSKNLIDPDFMEAWIARSRWYGYITGDKYGEAFDMRRPPGIKSLKSLTNLYR